MHSLCQGELTLMDGQHLHAIQQQCLIEPRCVRGLGTPQSHRREMEAAPGAGPRHAATHGGQLCQASATEAAHMPPLSAETPRHCPISCASPTKH